jgi:hypothetical protein
MMTTHTKAPAAHAGWLRRTWEKVATVIAVIRLLAGIATVVIAISTAHAHSVGQKVTANHVAVACKSWGTMTTLVGLTRDDPAFANFWREQKRTGECRTFTVGEQVIVEQDIRSVDQEGTQRARMCARPVGERRCYWTHPGAFD